MRAVNITGIIFKQPHNQHKPLQSHSKPQIILLDGLGLPVFV